MTKHMKIQFYFNYSCEKTNDKKNKLLNNNHYRLELLSNNERPHIRIGNLTPNQVHKNNIKTEKLWKNYCLKNPIIVNQ